MAIIDLPYQDIIDRSSGPSSEGFALEEVRYSGKVSQRTFNGPSVEASRTEVWKVTWSLLQKDIDFSGVDYDIDVIREFYRQSQVNKIRWRPFEIGQTRIWRIVQNSLKVSNNSGCNFQATISLEFLYNE